MLKGVHHQMIEIGSADNPYFERALLVLRPDCTDPNAAHLAEEARRMLQTVGGYTALYKNRRRARIMRFVWSLLGLGAGVTLGFLIAAF